VSFWTITQLHRTSSDVREPLRFKDVVVVAPAIFKVLQSKNWGRSADVKSALNIAPLKLAIVRQCAPIVDAWYIVSALQVSQNRNLAESDWGIMKCVTS